jgi:RND family efflux transporter MFP subunit
MNRFTSPLRLRSSSSLSSSLLSSSSRFPAALALALFAAACAPAKETPPPQAPPPIAVRTAKVLREPRAQPITGTGVLSSKAEMKASFKTGGIISRIVVDEGDAVKRGQVLAVIRATEVEVAVEQANQGVAKAERDLARAQSLFEGSAATKEQLDDASTAAAIARSQLRAAKFNKDNSVIRAPSDGRVLRRLAEPNELVAPGQPVLVLSGDSAGWVMRVSLADRDVVRVAESTPAEVELSAWPGAPLSGAITEIASAASVLGTYEIEVAVSEPKIGTPRPPETPALPENMTLRSGMIGKIRISPSTTRVVALIPASALRDGEGKSATVWQALPDGAVSAHRVKVAFFVDNLAAISEGLESVEEVITDGAAYLTEKSKVAIAASSAAAAEAATPLPTVKVPAAARPNAASVPGSAGAAKGAASGGKP